MAFEVPRRLETDGKVELMRDGEDHLILVVSSSTGDMQHIRMSQFTAARVFALIAILLQIPLPKSLMKALKF